MKRDDIVICSQGMIGVLKSDEPGRVTYPDGTWATAWVGYHLSVGPGHEVGSPWSSRRPHVIGSAPGLAAWIESHQCP